MRKFMKSCAITALVLIVLGLVMAIMAGSIKGRTAIKDVVEAVTGGRVQINLDSLEEFGITIGNNIFTEIEENANYDIKDAMIFDDSFEIFHGDVPKYSLGSQVRELDVEVGGCVFTVEQSGDDNFYVGAKNTKKFQGYTKGNTLYLKGTTESGVLGDVDKCEIVLYVPVDFTFDKADMELGAGVMELDSFAANKLDLGVGAGQITIDDVKSDSLKVSVGLGEILIDNVHVNKLDANVDMGHLYIAGSVQQKIDAECAMGSLELEIAGSQKDFNYDLECGMGNLQFGEKSLSGVAQEEHVNNNAVKSMDIKCAMGNVEIRFTE